MATAASSVSAADAVRGVLRDVLALSAARAASLRADTPLFGAMPELDSMAVASVLTEIEDRLGILIDDDDVTAESFATFGALVALAEGKLRA